ncbi:YncE family protein [Mycobacterium botniense]|uniref:YncE family protein n=1 Tax=Mycobacterium botniense TaxID=84962 RepID=UPI0013D32561|nr:hypothetical protein [Mycobacterium botniense]
MNEGIEVVGLAGGAERQVAAAPFVDAGTGWCFTVVADVAVNNGPIGGMDITSDGRRLVVTNHGAHSVSVVDTRTCTVVDTVAGTPEPFAVAMSEAAPDRAHISTASPAYDAIAAVDLCTRTVAAVYPIALSVRDLAIGPDGQRVYLSRTGVDCADVAILNTGSGRVDAITIAGAPGTTPQCLRISSDAERLYLATNGPSGGRIVVIDACRQQAVDIIEIHLPLAMSRSALREAPPMLPVAMRTPGRCSTSSTPARTWLPAHTRYAGLAAFSPSSHQAATGRGSTSPTPAVLWCCPP